MNENEKDTNDLTNSIGKTKSFVPGKLYTNNRAFPSNTEDATIVICCQDQAVNSRPRFSGTILVDTRLGFTIGSIMNFIHTASEYVEFEGCLTLNNNTIK
jgi:fructose-specific phosphotransferase system component IIB